MAAYAQFVIGPPGAGKSTYCAKMQEFLRGLHRDVAVVNLDPANESARADVDVRELIALDEVTARLDLGPNGGLVYCMEFLARNMGWLQERLQQRSERYFLFDCPGQVELFTHHPAMHSITQTVARDWRFHVCTVNLVDSHHCADTSKFLSVLLTSLAAMLLLEMPHVNVLSKVDLIEQFGTLPFGLDFYTDVLDLSYLLETTDSDVPALAVHQRLNAAMVELVEEFSLVHFHPLNVQDRASMAGIMMAVDKAVSYIHVPDEAQHVNMLTTAFGAVPEHERPARRAAEQYMHG